MGESIFSYFTDSVLRGPMFGSIFICCAAALIGVLVFLRKESLIGEALSHAAYPGLIAGVFFCGLLFGDDAENPLINFAVLLGALVTSLAGLQLIHFLEKRCRVKQDAALCFVLSYFFGVGILLSSQMQFSFSNLYRQAQVYFYGQAATMTDFHAYMFFFIALAIALILYTLRKEFEVYLFDANFAKSIGVSSQKMQWLLCLLAALAIVVGIRAVGVVMMSAMMIAPAVAARQCTDSFSRMCLYASFIGVVSGAVGTYGANEASILLKAHYPGARLTLPTGPLIVLTASLICLLALLFSPSRGALTRFWRLKKFRKSCLNENILKAVWRRGEEKECSPKDFQGLFSVSSFTLRRVFRGLFKSGYLSEGERGSYFLTEKGVERAKKIVRLHRLWELYLADYIGIGVERVHANAEEMEHILTPELEAELDALLKRPKFDPHHQPIPEGLKDG